MNLNIHICINDHQTSEEISFIHIIQHVHHLSLSKNTIVYINGKEIDKNTYLKISLSCNQLRRCNVPPNHRQVCPSTTQQHCHPRAKHDSTSNKGKLAGSHVAKDTQNSVNPTQLGLSSYRQTSQYTSQFIRL